MYAQWIVDNLWWVLCIVGVFGLFTILWSISEDWEFFEMTVSELKVWHLCLIVMILSR